MTKKRAAALILAVLTLICSTSALAAAGSSSDPLISLDYITGTYINDFIAKAGSVIDSALLTVEHYAKSMFGTGVFAPEGLSAGNYVILTTGNGVIPVSGTAKLYLTHGTVINVTTGQTVSTGTELVTGNRYLAAENTYAVVSLGSSAQVMLDGGAESGTAIPRDEFLDNPESFWAYEYISSLSGAGLINGRGNGIFDANSNMTRADFVTLLGRLHGVDASQYTAGGFIDVDASKYYAPYIQWASENGLVNGYNETTFGTSDSITRAQLATLMIRYANFAGYDVPVWEAASAQTEDTAETEPAQTEDAAEAEPAETGDAAETENPSGDGALQDEAQASEAPRETADGNVIENYKGELFSDHADIADWALTGVYLARDMGLITGRPGNLFDPGGNATRAEVCAIISRLG